MPLFNGRYVYTKKNTFFSNSTPARTFAKIHTLPIICWEIFYSNIISKVPPLIMKDAETLRTQSNISKMDFRGEIVNDL